MAEGDIHVYREFKKGLMDSNYDLVNDNVIALLVSGYTLDGDGHTLLSDVVANEISDPSYSRQTLTGKTVTPDGAGVGKFDAANITFSNLSGTDPNYLILFDDTSITPLDPLICAMELTTATNGGDYIISWNAAGIMRIS